MRRRPYLSGVLEKGDDVSGGDKRVERVSRDEVSPLHGIRLGCSHHSSTPALILFLGGILYLSLPLSLSLFLSGANGLPQTLS